MKKNEMVEHRFSNQERETQLRRKIADGSGDPDDYRNLAELQFAAGHCDEAIALYEKALDLSLTNCQRAQLSMELGWIFYEIGRRTKAESLAQTAIELLSWEPESAEVLSYRGSSQSLLAHCLWFTDADVGAEAARLALESLEQVMAKAPEFDGITTVYYEAARLHNMLGHTDKAITLCEKCLQDKLSERERLSCLMTYIEALRLAERFREAEDTLEEAFRYTESIKGILPNLYYLLGLIQRSTNRIAEARKAFQKALEALKADVGLRDYSDFFTQIYWNLGELYYDSEDYTKALEVFQKILDYHPEDDLDYRNAFLWLGHCYFETGAYTKARECYDKVLASSHSSDEEVADAREGLAKLDYTLEQYKEAAAAFEEVLSHCPKDDPHKANIMLWLGNCYEGTGDYVKAQDYFEKIMASPHASADEKASAQEGLSRLPPSPKKTLH